MPDLGQTIAEKQKTWNRSIEHIFLIRESWWIENGGSYLFYDLVVSRRLNNACGKVIFPVSLFKALLITVLVWLIFVCTLPQLLSELTTAVHTTN